jgi:hypothetical protein
MANHLGPRVNAGGTLAFIDYMSAPMDITIQLLARFQMKKLIAVLMVAAFAGTAVPSFAQTPATPAAPSAAPATPAATTKAKQGKKHSKKQNKTKTDTKN